MGRGRGRASRRRHRVDKAGAFVPRHLGAIGVFITDPREGGWDCDEAQSAHRVSGKQSLAQEAVRVLGPADIAGPRGQGPHKVRRVAGWC